MKNTPADSAKKTLHASLLTWYEKHRRKMPWREEVSPYRTWISEIMLQQTQVSTAIPYFEKFMERFPDVRSLAAATEEEVLRYWAGLGYYSRARNLHNAAHEVLSRYGGNLPDTAEQLMLLRGIGRYTAGAIASIAFHRPSPLVDGNVIRVYARLFALRGTTKSSALQKKVWELASSNLDEKRPGEWNQSLMELGALVCLPPPETPRCLDCPVSTQCLAFRQGTQHLLPEASAQKEPVMLSWTALWIERRGKILLWRRGNEERFLRGHWGLPETRHLKKVSIGKELRKLRHSITHHRITLAVREGRLNGGIPIQARWVPRKQLEEFLVSSLWRKAAQNLRPRQQLA